MVGYIDFCFTKRRQTENDKFLNYFSIVNPEKSVLARLVRVVH